MLQKLPVFGGIEFVIKRDENATAKEDSVSGEQPLGLIRHDDAGAIASGKTGILQSSSEWMRAVLEIVVGEALFFALAVCLDEASLCRERDQRIFQRGANRLVFGKVQHYKRDWIRSASVRKSLTPWTS